MLLKKVQIKYKRAQKEYPLLKRICLYYHLENTFK